MESSPCGVEPYPVIGPIAHGSSPNEAIWQYFGHQTYRPHQEDMLLFAYDTIDQQEHALINAPTGCGKSSVISAALAATGPNEKIIVAVKTISQLNVFMSEIDAIRNANGIQLPATCIIGKNKICPKLLKPSLVTEQGKQKGQMQMSASNIYEICQLLVAGSKRNDRDPRQRCEYYDECRNDDTLTTERARALQYCSISPDDTATIEAICGDACPYEVTMKAATTSKIIILNYHHIFNNQIRARLYDRLGITVPPVLIIDEAHNAADTVRQLNSYKLIVTDYDAIIKSFTTHVAKERIAVNTDFIKRVATSLYEYASQTAREMSSSTRETLFDANDFIRTIRESTGTDNDENPDDDSILFEKIHATMTALEEYNTKRIQTILKTNPDLKKESIEDDTTSKQINTIGKILSFVYNGINYKHDISYFKIISRDEKRGDFALEYRNIDPSAKIASIAAEHRSVIFMSGTLSPLHVHNTILFGKEPARTYSVPFSFPRKNRRVYCAMNYTSEWRNRSDPTTVKSLIDYIIEFMEIDGNTAIFFPSYDLMASTVDKVIGALDAKNLQQNIYIESRNNSLSAESLAEFRRLPTFGDHGTIMGVCGGKWFEGIDYKGNELVGAMVVGLPLPQFTPIVTHQIQYYRQKFNLTDKTDELIGYTLPAINKAVQSLGRVLRSETDRGVLFLCDRRYTRRDIMSALPEWIADEMIAVNTNAEFNRDIRKTREKMDL